MKNLFCYVIVVVLLTSCSSKAPETRAVVAKDVEVTGILKDYIRVVNGTYYLRNDATEKNVAITIKVEVVKQPKVVYTKRQGSTQLNIVAMQQDPLGQAKKDIVYYELYPYGELVLNVIDTFGTVCKFRSTSCHFSLERRYDDEAEWEKLRDLLTSPVGTQKTLTFNNDYHWDDDEKSAIKRMMCTAGTFEIIDNAFRVNVEHVEKATPVATKATTTVTPKTKQVVQKKDNTKGLQHNQEESFFHFMKRKIANAIDGVEEEDDD